MQYNHKAIIIGGDHHNTLGVIRSLGEKGIKPYVFITTKRDKSFISKSKYIEKYWYVDENEESIINLLKENFNNEEYKPIIITCSDGLASIIDKNINLLKNKFIYSSSNDRQGELTNYMNKNNMNENAKNSNFLTPKTWEICIEKKYDITNICFPCIVKPILSHEGSKDDIVKCDNIENLNSVIDNYINKNYKNLLIQEYIEKDYEIIVFGFVTKNKDVILTSFAKKIIISPPNIGGTVFCKSYKTISEVVDKKNIEKFFENCPYMGIFSMELLVKRDKVYFMEINYRNDAMSYSSTFFGANIPYEYYLSCIDKEYDSDLKIKKEGYFLLETRALINVLKRNLSFFTFVSCLIKSDTYLIWNKKDIKPFFYKFLYR